MITEDYVSFEVAKLLKEKGFNEPCNGRYSYRGGNVIIENYPISNESLKYHPNIDGISAPTLQMVDKWLREKHNLSIDRKCTIHGFFCAIVHMVKDENGRLIDVEDSIDWETRYCDTLEEAVNAAIIYALENLV